MRPSRNKRANASTHGMLAGYDILLSDVARVISHGRRGAARSVNAVITATYWLIGRRIVEEEQGGAIRAGYGQALIEQLSADLVSRFGRGFSRQNLQQTRQFYLLYPLDKIRQTLSGKSAYAAAIRRMTSGGSLFSHTGVVELSGIFPLPWSHYVQLLAVKGSLARAFYEAESLRGGWTVRQLERQIASQFYERTALSRDKATLLSRGGVATAEDAISPEEEIKDPFVLEFLALKDEYSETDLESALIANLETFLLELGSDFAFVGRQRRLRLGDEWYRVDLLFFHRQLRCLVIVDLKLDKFTHADAGQMHLYLNYAREHWMRPGENPPVGLILCTQKDHAVAKYALEGLPNKVLAAEYRTALPDERLLVEQIEKTRRLMETRRGKEIPHVTTAPRKRSADRQATFERGR